MRLNLKRINQSFRLANHLMFWLLCIAVLTLLNPYGKPGQDFQIAFNLALILIPVHIVYFCINAYLIIPIYLRKKNYPALFIALTGSVLLMTFIYRIVELMFVFPYLSNSLPIASAHVDLADYEFMNMENIISPEPLISAFQKVNSIIWFAISLNFIKMWHEKRQISLQAELNSIKAQIHPHFLFNTLNNLYALTLKQSPSSPEIVLGLSEVLRYSLYECNTTVVKLSRDIEILTSYIKLEKIRYQDRLDLDLTITGASQGYYVAPLLMLPLVENAFKHGTAETIDNPWIKIDINICDNKLKFKVSNSRPINEPENLAQDFEKPGLENVRKRLDLNFKNAYELIIYNEEEMFVVILEIQLLKEDEIDNVI
ncbi:histidine kinase [Pedobacter sp. B4-66]|uniref:sensor histidine kinase n=1 Tax=Pedobacter sp. B4-66 TaxID=2817280 RepID=UPI001BD94D0C|nr:histidine kinase [Pedobacter sp. B4-66]